MRSERSEPRRMATHTDSRPSFEARASARAPHKKVRTVFQPSREMENRLSSAAGRSCRLATQDDGYCLAPLYHTRANVTGMSSLMVPGGSLSDGGIGLSS